mmetsp:Transcript_45756/g.111390  ORF Transcript_45756/g.111390 Transcript_45756/m.111390 type:complete len:203 (-) Transcript_45756:397-1005(-)|eukprot:CAMPEP_0206246844 /NCGR_PEP_ID=MMETSP0047_2-20121206/19487_1 /ASSEMBLY_ACC=CAM_ASM_000192 /TAXON_ID=195065 /ORGANISM="Chroomonas mesostigmatica_cf, Strain CCMP1168" /LENGTH=202 /DNA_ID=CAMNT_0053672317 /DNA_START=164 /DNA_END=772 /DNA_ORIENTATION=+
MEPHDVGMRHAHAHASYAAPSTAHARACRSHTKVVLELHFREVLAHLGLPVVRGELSRCAPVPVLCTKQFLTPLFRKKRHHVESSSLARKMKGSGTVVVLMEQQHPSPCLHELFHHVQVPLDACYVESRVLIPVRGQHDLLSCFCGQKRLDNSDITQVRGLEKRETEAVVLFIRDGDLGSAGGRMRAGLGQHGRVLMDASRI